MAKSRGSKSSLQDRLKKKFEETKEAREAEEFQAQADADKAIDTDGKVGPGFRPRKGEHTPGQNDIELPGRESDIDITKMTREEFNEYVKNNPNLFENMSSDDFGSWMWDNWTQYQKGVDKNRGSDIDYMNRANSGSLFGVFNESPLYKIPDEVFQKMEMFQETAIAGVRGALRSRETSMDTLQQGIDKSIGTLTEARDESLGMAREDIDRIRDIGERSRQFGLDQGYKARRETLAELQRGGDRALDIQRLQAFGGLPGERMMREQTNANFAATTQAVKERAGAGSGALGAIAQGYGAQQGVERQLAVDRAQYQAQGMANLAQGEFGQSGRMADAMRQSRMDIAGIEQTSARDMAQSYLDTSKFYTGLQGDYAGQISRSELVGAQSMADTDLRSSQAITDAAFAGADLMGGGFDTLAGERRQQFAINQYEPYMSQRDFLQNELQRLDPFGVQAQYYGDLMGQGQSQYLAGVQGQNVSNQSGFNAFGNMMGNVAQWGVNYEGGGDKTGNDVVYGNPQYDDPWLEK